MNKQKKHQQERDSHSQAIANNMAQHEQSDSANTFVDNRPEAIFQRKLSDIANESQQVKKGNQMQLLANNGLNNPGSQDTQPIQKKENKTGLPDQLKSGIENLSGYSMDDVKVHRNSDKPAQLQAHAFAQGTDIHVAPGQERHLPHEAWHVVQQKQGRVKPTMQFKGKVNINDNKGLEREADVMGGKALRTGAVAQRQELEEEEAPKNPTPEEMEILEELGGVIQGKFKSGASGSDVIQRAYIARRALGGVVSFGLGSRFFKDKGVFHEHIFFEDDKDPGDIGFHNGDDKLFQDTPDMLGLYKTVISGLDDQVMREAVRMVGDPGTYELLGNNCQRYVRKVLTAYDFLKDRVGNAAMSESIGDDVL